MQVQKKKLNFWIFANKKDLISAESTIATTEKNQQLMSNPEEKEKQDVGQLDDDNSLIEKEVGSELSNC